MQRSWMMALAVGCGIASGAWAQLPQPRLHAVHPLGGQVGQALELTLSGEDLDGVDRLIFSHPGITAEPVASPADAFYPEPRPVGNRYIVKVAPQVPPGVYDVRCVGALGVSNARRWAVETQPAVPEVEPNNSPEASMPLPLDTWVDAATDKEAYDHYRFEARAGQRLIVHAVSERLLSNAKVVITLFDAAGKELARSSVSPSLDAMLDWTVPADGPYTLRVHDRVYDGTDAVHGYRLIVTQGPWIDFVDPPVIQADTDATVTLYGRNLPAPAQPAEGVTIEGRPLQQLQTQLHAAAKDGYTLSQRFRPAAAGMDHAPIPVLPASPVTVALTQGPTTPEIEPNDQPEQAHAFYPPAELIGRFGRKNDNDWYRFEATKGDRLTLELFAQRIGHSVDASVLVQRLVPQPDGTTVAQDLIESDDAVPYVADKNHPLYRYPTDSTDPALLLTVPETGVYRLLVRDQYGSAQGDARMSYRLSVRPFKPDFQLIAFPFQSTHIQPKKDIDLVPQAAVVRPGQTLGVMLAVVRPPGVTEEIMVHVEGLPEGVTAEPVTIPGWQSHAMVTLKADVSSKPWVGSPRIVGIMPVSPELQVERVARAAELFDDVAGGRRPAAHMVGSFHMSVAGDLTFPVAVELAQPAEQAIKRGTSLQIPVKLNKQGAFNGGVVLKPIGIGGDMSVPDAGLNEQNPQGQVVLNIGANAPLGSFSFVMHGTVAAPVQRNPAAAARAEQDKTRIVQIHAQAVKALEEAAKARQGMEENAKSVTDNPEQVAQAMAAVLQAREAEAHAQLFVQQADEARKKAESDAQQAVAAAAAKELPIPVTTNTITLRVVE